MRRAAGLNHRPDLLGHHAVLARKERPAVDHHVDLVGPVGDRLLDIAHTDRQRVLPRREPRRDRCDIHAAAREVLLRVGHHRRVHAHRRDMPKPMPEQFLVALPRAFGLGTQAPHLLGRVAPLERGQINHRDGHLQRRQLRRLLDRARRERFGASIHHDRINGRRCGEHRLVGLVGHQLSESSGVSEAAPSSASMGRPVISHSRQPPWKTLTRFLTKPL